MSQLRVYFNPFDDAGNYTEFVEVSEDVSLNSLGTITSKVEGSDYDVGVVTLSNIKVDLVNDSGRYSEVADINSMFRYRRAGTKVRVTWQKGDDEAHCGFAICGESYPYAENIVYEGLLDDESATSDLKTSQVSFNVLSYTSLLTTVETPFSSLSNGQLVSEILAILLAEFSSTFTVNTIAPQYDAVIDDVSSFEDTDVKEVLETLLTASNSVLYFDIDEAYIVGRVPSADVKQTYYGQASNQGVEDMVKVSKIKSGLSRTFNLWKWTDSTETSRNQTSIDDNGLRINELEIESITNTVTKQALLNSYKDEFGNIKREFDVTVPFDIVTHNALDKINFDYPTPYYTREDDAFPVYGVARYGVSKYPFGEFGLVLTTNELFKILSIRIDLKKDLITYSVREI